jgi:mannose-6-phosphate isomerase-like protein (cupin superfamily)
MLNYASVDLSKFAPGLHGEYLAGPPTGAKSCWVICTRLQSGARGPRLHVHPADQYYYIIRGEMNVQLGQDVFVIGADTLVRIPKDTPHCNWNTRQEDEFHLEVIAPPPPRDGISSLAQPRLIPNASTLISPAPLSAPDKSSFPAAHAVWIGTDVHEPASKDLVCGPRPFDRFYFVMSGLMAFQIGDSYAELAEMSLMTIPSNTPFRMRNAGPETVRQIEICVAAH